MADQAFDPSKPFTLLQGGKSDPAPAKVLPDIGAHAGRPAAGRGTQLDLDKSNRGVELATTPLAHPTGIDAIDNFTSPVGIASLAAGGAGIVRAGVAEGTGAAVKTAAATASPLLKFEATRRAMMAIGAPDWLATGAAAYVAGIKGKGAADIEHISQPGFPRTSVGAAPEAVAAAPTNLSRVPAGSLTQEQIAERLAATKAGAVPEAATVTAKPPAGTRLAEQRAAFEARVAARQAPAVSEVPAEAPIASPAAASPASAAPAGKFSTQKALNELALAARRAKTTISPQEADQLIQAVEGGQTAKDAVASLLQERLAKFPGMMSDAEVQAALDARHAAGAIKTPSAATAAARRKGARP